MKGAVAIVGAVQTRYETAKKHQAYNELVYEVVSGLLRQSGVKMAEVHSQVTASQDMYDGKTISSMAINEVVGGYLKSEAKVAADGIQAVLYGAARILSGVFEYTLVTAHCKESESQRHAVTVSMFDPFCQRPLGIDEAVAMGLQARRYMQATGITENELAEVSRRNHRAALQNPLALRKGEFSIGEILDSSPVAGPLREMLLAPRCDGACALLLANAERAKAFGRRAVWITGMGNASDAYWTDRDLSQSRALQEAARRAYQMAGITDPCKQVQVAEVSARGAHEEPLYATALGIAPAGDVPRWLKEGGAGGPIINPSGGALTGNPPSVTGLARVIEAYWQLADSAGEHQVPAARVALAHGADGICGQNQSVVVLERPASA